MEVNVGNVLQLLDDVLSVPCSASENLYSTTMPCAPIVSGLSVVCLVGDGIYMTPTPNGMSCPGSSVPNLRPHADCPNCC